MKTILKVSPAPPVHWNQLSVREQDALLTELFIQNTKTETAVKVGATRKKK